MKNCEYYQMLISTFYDDNIPIESNDEIQTHLNDCSDCQAFQQSIIKQTSLFYSLPEIPYQLKLPQAPKEKWYQNRLSLSLAQAAALIMFLSVWSILNFYQSFSAEKDPEEFPNNIAIEQVETIQTINFSPQPAMLVEANSAGDNSQTNEEESL